MNFARSQPPLLLHTKRVECLLGRESAGNDFAGFLRSISDTADSCRIERLSNKKPTIKPADKNQ